MLVPTVADVAEALNVVVVEVRSLEDDEVEVEARWLEEPQPIGPVRARRVAKMAAKNCCPFSGGLL